MYKSKKVILLGAGAMIPFGGSTTQELTNRLLVYDKCNTIYKIIQKDYRDTCNFETLLSAVELLLEWSFSNEGSGYLTSQSIYKSIFQKSSSFYYKSKIDFWELYKIIVNEIIESIKEYDYYPYAIEDCKDSSSIILQRYIIECRKKSALKIYTLNYDRLIPKMIKNEENIDEGIDNNRYSYDLIKFINHPMTYFNLHGSIYIHYDCSGLTIKDYPVELEKPYTLSGGNPNEHKIFLPIIAGYHKSQRLLSEPFNFGAGAFMYDCNTCDELMIIGYSFGDPHINSILKNFINRSSANIVIIDYSHDISFPPLIKKRIDYVFNISTTFSVINNGIFFDKDNHIMVYLIGFEKFISESL